VVERPSRMAERQRSRQRVPNARQTKSGFLKTSELVITPFMVRARCIFRATATQRLIHAINAVKLSGVSTIVLENRHPR